MGDLTITECPKNPGFPCAFMFPGGDCVACGKTSITYTTIVLESKDDSTGINNAGG